MAAKKPNWRKLLNKEERRIYDSIMASFPATDPASAYDKAIEGGVNWQFQCK